MSIFISYRNTSGGLEAAKLIKGTLEIEGFTVFLDESLSSGEYFDTILKKIEECDHFIFVMPKDAFKKGKKRKDRSRDIYIEELEHAIRCKKNIIPIATADYDKIDYSYLPEELKRSHQKKGFEDIEVVSYNTKTMSFAMERILSMISSPGKPLDIDIDAEIEFAKAKRISRKKRIIYGIIIFLLIVIIGGGSYVYMNMTFISKYDRQVQEEYLVCMGSKTSEDDEWNKSLVETTRANVGDEVHFQIHFENSTGASVENVMVGVNMPENLRYVNDSTVLYNATNPDGILRDNTLITISKNSNDKIVNEKPADWFLDGVNIGGYSPYGDGYICFDAIVVDDVPGTYRVWCNVSVADYYVVQYTDIEIVD